MASKPICRRGSTRHKVTRKYQFSFWDAVEGAEVTKGAPQLIRRLSRLRNWAFQLRRTFDIGSG